MAGISVEFLINILRKEVGLDAINIADHLSNQNEIPEWFNKESIFGNLDITPLIESGQHPLQEVMKRLQKLSDGKIFELIAPFFLAPLVDMAREKDFKVFSKNSNDGTKVLIYFIKNKKNIEKN